MRAAAKRVSITLLFLLIAYAAMNDAWTMLVQPPKGDAVLTADQQTTLNRQTAIDAERAFDSAAASYLTWHHCQTVTAWKNAHPGQYPATMVQHLDHSTRIEQVKWTYPAAHGEYVIGFCS